MSDERKPEALPPKPAGDPPGDSLPRALEGYSGGIRTETRTEGGPSERSALLAALARSALVAFDLTELKIESGLHQVEAKLTEVEAKLAEVGGLVASLADSRAAAPGTELGAAVRKAVSSLLADVAPIREQLQAARECVAAAERLVDSMREGGPANG